MCCQDGSSLPLGQQLRRFLQLEVLSSVLGVCVFGVGACTVLDCEQGLPMYLAVVCNVLAGRIGGHNDCQHLFSVAVRNICLCDVLRSTGSNNKRKKHNRPTIVKKRRRTCH